MSRCSRAAGCEAPLPATRNHSWRPCAVLAVVLAASRERRSFRVAAVSARFSTAMQDSCLGHTWVAQFAGTMPAILTAHHSSQMPRSKQSVLCAQTLADSSIRGSSHRD